MISVPSLSWVSHLGQFLLRRVICARKTRATFLILIYAGEWSTSWRFTDCDCNFPWQLIFFCSFLSWKVMCINISLLLVGPLGAVCCIDNAACPPAEGSHSALTDSSIHALEGWKVESGCVLAGGVALWSSVHSIPVLYIHAQSVSCAHLRFRQLSLKALGRPTMQCGGLKGFFLATTQG